MSDEPLRVLLVDDEVSLRQPLKEYLCSGYDYHVDAAANAEQALELVRAAKLPYHVALIDDMLSPSTGRLPIRSGVELMSQIKIRSPRTEVIIFTGWGMKGALEAMQAGAFRYLAKPFNAEELAILIRHAAQQHHLLKERDTLKLLGAISDQLNLSHLDPDALLQETISLATDSIGAKEGSLLVVKEDGSLQNWRSHGLLEMSDEKAKTILAKGCAKWVIENCQSARLDDFRADPRWLLLPDDSFEQGSALLVPLKDGDKAIGVMSFTIGETYYFKEDHQILIESIASQAAIAIRHAALFRQTDDLAHQLHVQKEKLDRFVACSPNGQIAVDTRGKINLINERGLQILGYAEEDLIGTAVHPLYLEESEARRIGQLLADDPDHTVRAERTDLVTKDKRPIPVLLSATYWYDSNGVLLGSIGYFENLTEIQKKDDQLAVLSKASEIMAQAEKIDEGLDALARLLVKRLDRSFCGIFLHNENSSTLLGKVFYVHPDVKAEPQADSPAEYKIKISSCALLQELFENNQCKIVSQLDPWQEELNRFVGHLQLKEPIQSLLLVPLKSEEKIVGLLSLGEVREESVYPFTPDETELATAIAHQITGLIDRRLQLEIAGHRGVLLDKLSRALFHSGRPIPKLEQEITQYAAEVLGYAMSFLFFRRPGQEELELCQAFPENALPPAIRSSSEKGLLGEVVWTDKPRFRVGYDEWAGRESVFNQFHFKTVVAVPVKSGEQVEYVLVVADQNSRPFVETEQEVLERLAMRASLSLQNAQLTTQKEKVYQRLNILHHVSFYTQRMLGDERLNGAERLARLLHVTLTGATAGYGLGFNRATVFLLDERGEHLVGQCGIGQFDPFSAKAVWQELQTPALEDFFRYTKLLEQGKIKQTPVGAAAHGLRLECGPAADNVLSEMLDGRHGKGVILEGKQLKTLPDKLLAEFSPGSQVAVAPLTARGHVFGVLIADNNFTQTPITPEDLKSLMTFVNAAAVAIENHNLLQQRDDARRRQEALSRASDKLVAPQDPDQVLQNICELTKKATGAKFAGIILVDEANRPLRVIPDEIGRRLDPARDVRADGISLEVMRGGQHVAIPDLECQSHRANPMLIENGVKAAVCLPFFAQDRRHGVLWIAYDHPHNFSDQELKALQLYVNQAASTYDSARRMKELRATRNTANAVARVTTLGDLDTTLKTIVHGTKETTGCEPIVLFVYDQKQDSFRDPPTMAGVNNEQMASRHQVPKGSIVHEIMEQRQTVIATDVSSHPMFKDKPFVERERIQSCLAVPLYLGQESVGVLFVNDRSQHNFTLNEQRNIELFASQTAVAIGNTRLYAALQKRVTALKTLHEAGAEITGTLDEREVVKKIIRQVWKLADKENSFASVRQVVGDEAVLVAFHPAPPPDDHPILLNPGEGKPIGITGRAVRDKCSQLVGDVTKSQDYIKYHSSTQTELTVPVMIDGEVVYVINLEHPELYAFDEEDKRDLESLAMQAAIAIQNARKYESLIEANMQVKASTELSWMDMVSGVWRHEIEGKAVTIVAQVGLILDDLDGNPPTKEQNKRLEKIKEMAEKILSYKITPPISSEDGVTSVSVNDLLTERFRTLQDNDPYQSVEYILDLLPGDSLEVQISLDWLQVACDIVIDNAVRAVKDSTRKEVCATTSHNNGRVEIAIADTGKGIPEKVFNKLFTGVISKEDGGEGLGGGLLKAQAIIKKYGGEILIPWTSTEGETTGTRVVIQLPRQN